MGSGDLAVGLRVTTRENFHGFKAACARAATQAVQEAVNEEADLAREFVHVKSGDTMRSITPEMLGPKSGRVVAGGAGILAEEDTVPHSISGNLRFFWERAPEGPRWFGPPHPATVQHPGTAGQHFLRRAHKIVLQRMPSILRRFYP